MRAWKRKERVLKEREGKKRGERVNGGGGGKGGERGREVTERKRGRERGEKGRGRKRKRGR